MRRRILKECLRRARTSHGPNHPYWKYKSIHYSFIIQNNKVLSMGRNVPKVRPPIYYGYPKYAYIHAEIDAWKKARGILETDKFELVNIRLTRTNRIVSSIPCSQCLEFMTSQGCEAIYSTTENGWHIIKVSQITPAYI